MRETNRVKEQRVGAWDVVWDPGSGRFTVSCGGAVLARGKAMGGKLLAFQRVQGDPNRKASMQALQMMGALKSEAPKLMTKKAAPKPAPAVSKPEKKDSSKSRPKPSRMSSEKPE